MEKDDLVVGKVRINPIDNKMCPCIRIIMSEGMGDGDLVLLKVIDSKFDYEFHGLEQENEKLREQIKKLKQQDKR